MVNLKCQERRLGKVELFLSLSLSLFLSLSFSLSLSLSRHNPTLKKAAELGKNLPAGGARVCGDTSKLSSIPTCWQTSVWTKRSWTQEGEATTAF